MGIDLCGCDTLVSQHFLHCPQIGTSFQQMGGKGVPQGMGGNSFLYTRRLCCRAQHLKYIYPRKRFSVSVEEHMVFKSAGNGLMHPDGLQVQGYTLQGCGSNWDESVFIALPYYPNEFFFCINIGNQQSG